MSVARTLWCRITRRHKGHVGYIDPDPFWMCDRCGEIHRPQPTLPDPGRGIER